MNVNNNSIKGTIKNMSSILGLNILLFFGFFIPGLGVWARRIFFILCTRNELERIRTFSKIPLDTLNDRLLKISTPVVLTNVCEWSRAYSYRIDVELLKLRGFDVNKLSDPDSVFTPRELDLLSIAIMQSAPPKLNYGEHAMYNDIQRILCDQAYSCKV